MYYYRFGTKKIKEKFQKSYIFLVVRPLPPPCPLLVVGPLKKRTFLFLPLSKSTEKKEYLLNFQNIFIPSNKLKFNVCFCKNIIFRLYFLLYFKYLLNPKFHFPTVDELLCVDNHGKGQNETYLCLLSNNAFNQYYFLVLWFWWSTLIIISVGKLAARCTVVYTEIFF